MTNRIDERFRRLRGEGRKGFIAYISAGDPNLELTVELCLALEECGADFIELGIPFSDPLADGIVNQQAAQRALKAGTTVCGVLEAIQAVRQRSEVPIVLYTYMNPIYAFGFERFHLAAEAAGVDGMLILDLPPDEDRQAAAFANPSSLRRIRLIAPTTPPARMKEICDGANGFIYYVSREGVTGEQTSVATSLLQRVEEIRSTTSLPIAVGFGISNPDQAREVAACADAVVVGSAIVKKIAEAGAPAQLVERVRAFVRPLVAAVKSRTVR